MRLLTDPVLRERVAHLRRLAPVPAPPLQLDAVLVSHTHFDHFDPPSLRRLDRRVRVVVPRGGAGRPLRRLGFTDVLEAEEGSVVRVGPVTARAVHAEHGGARGTPRVGGRPLGYVVTGSRSVYFAGDTGLFPAMEGLVPGLDVALLPVAGWGPRLGPRHLDPDRAAEALRLLRPRLAVPIHWGTYARIAMRQVGPPEAPAERFRTRASEIAPAVLVRVLRPGESLTVE